MAKATEQLTDAEIETRKKFERNLSEIVRELESCGFECVAGPIENNVAFQVLKEMAQAEQEPGGIIVMRHRFESS